MFKNYIKTAVRVFNRDKTYSAVNILGLTVGITSSLMLFAYSFNESQYDQHHAQRDNIVRVVMDVNFGDDVRAVAVTPAALGHYMSSNAAVVADHAMLRPIVNSGFQVKKGEELIAESDMFYASQGVLRMFTFHWLAGDRGTALTPHNTIVLTRRLAEKYFGGVENAVGGVVDRDNGTQYRVTGVIENVVEKGHFTPAALVSLWDDSKPTNWRDWNWCTYLLLKGDSGELQGQLDQAFEEHLAPQLEQQGGGKITFRLQNLTDIYYESRLDFEMQPNGGNRLFIRGFAIVGGFLLLLAVINYVNLVTAQSQKRAREVGVKKAFGVSAATLRAQFFFEAFSYVIVAMALSFALLALLEPVFRYFTGDQLPFPLLLRWQGPAAIIFFVAGLTFLAGVYPAVLISAFRPAQVLKAGASQVAGGGLSLRRMLIVLQLSVSLLMTVGMAGVYLQLRFMSGYNLGFDKEQVVVFTLPAAAIENLRPLREALLRFPQITGVASVIEMPGEKPPVNDFTFETAEGEKTGIIQQLWADEGFFKTLAIPVIAGNDFSGMALVDEGRQPVLVNRAFAAQAGWEMDETPGKKIGSHDWSGHIVGVVEDFHIVSLHDKLEPIVFRYNFPSPNMLVRVNGPFLAGMDIIQHAAVRIAGEKLSSWELLDSKFQQQYDQDEKRADLLAVFAVVVLCIACLGLLGLTSYEVRRRRREIGVRKILGARPAGILLLFSRSYLGLIMWAALLSIPVANYLLTEWLMGFAYRIDVTWWMLTLPLVLLAGLCLLVVSVQARKATAVNPAEVLRHE